MPLNERIKRGVRQFKDAWHDLSRNPTPEPPSISVNNPPPSLLTPATPAPSVSAITQSTSVIQVHSTTSNQTTAAQPMIASSLAVPSTTQGGEGHTAWSGLRTFLKLLDRSANAFGPLKSAVDGILGCVEIYESIGKGRDSYDRLRDEIDTLFLELSEYFGGSTSPSSTLSLDNLTRGLEREVRLVQSKQARGTYQRAVESSEDADDVLESYRRIQGLLQRLTVNVSIGIRNAVDEQTIEHRLEKLVPSLAAQYSSVSAATLQRGRCTPNTRVDVLHGLAGWSCDVQGEKIYWLNGMAGTGKTTIAYSLCEMLQAGSKLAASFFCSRQLPECRDANLIFPTIAYQLARFSAPFRLALSHAIEQNPGVRARRLEDQLGFLIVSPLREVKDSFPEDLVIVIDAMDECEHGDGVGEILDMLLFNASNLSVKFLVTSRPELHIHSRMMLRQGERARFELHLHNLDRASVQEDIRTYLKTELEPLHPSSDDLAQLSKRSGVFFIYAATAVRYISAGKFYRGPARLKAVLDTSASSSNRSEKEIDALYTAILKAVLEDSMLEGHERTEVKLVLDTIVCAQEPLTMGMMASLLGLDAKGSILPAVQLLLSVLHVSDKNGAVTTLHESFPDYLRNLDRSGELHCDLGRHNALLAHRCFDLISQPEPAFNICKLESSHLFDKEFLDLPDRVERWISKELVYACQYWGAHLAVAEASQSLCTTLEYLLYRRLLFWLEILNLKQKVADGARLLPVVMGWCERAGCTKETRELILDGWAFITSYLASPMSLSTPHIYASALPFWPEDKPVSRCYMPQMKGLVRPTGTAMRMRTSALVAVFQCNNRLYSLACSPDGRRIATGCANGNILIWNARTGEAVGEPLQGHTDEVYSVAYSPDSTRIVSGSGDRTVRIWNAHTGHMIGEPLMGHSDEVRSVAFSPDGRRIVSGSNDTTIRIWDASTGQMVCEPLTGHTSYVYSVAFSPNGSHIASGSWDRTVRIWDAHTGKPVGEALQGHGRDINSISYSPNGTCIAYGSDDETIRIWDTGTGQIIGQPLRGHTDRVLSVVFSSDGSHIVSGSRDGTVQIWNAHTGRMIGEPLQGHTASVMSVTYSPDGSRIISASQDGTFRLWDAHASQTLAEPPQGHTGAIYSVAYSHDGSRIVSGSGDSTIRIWDAHSGQAIGGPIEGHTGDVNSVVLSPDGTRIVSGSDDSTVRIWDAHTGQAIGEPLLGHTKRVWTVAYSPNGSRVVSGSGDGSIRIWDAYTGEIIGTPLQGGTSAVRSVAYSPDGARIVSGYDDSTVRIWDAHTGQIVGEPLSGHTKRVWSVAYSPSGSHIVSGSGDQTIRIWDAYTGQMIGKPLRGHTNEVNSVTFSSDGSRIVSGSDDQTVRIWDALTGQIIGEPLHGHKSRVWSVASSPDGSHIVSGSEDRSVRIWAARDATATETGRPTHPWSAWSVSGDGWVVDDQSRPLIWVPPELRDALLYPQNTAMISKTGSLHLNFSEAKLGDTWGTCYQPKLARHLM